MTYYEQLKVSDNASANEIKKAYFTLVKQYPPERFPEKFKEYRKAYEVLSNVDARSQYDKLSKVPAEYKECYESALLALEEEDYEYAITLLKQVVKKNPELEILNSLLGEIYLENDNSGNAIKIFERLVKSEPDNASYQERLGRAYSMRGYTKKALAQFTKSISLDPDNIDLIIGLSDAYVNTGDIEKAWDTLHKAMLRLTKNNMNSLNLSIYALYICVHQRKMELVQEYIDVIKEAIQNDSDVTEYILKTLFSYLGKLKPDEELMLIISNLINALSEIIPDSLNMALIKDVYNSNYMLYKLTQDENVPDYIVDITNFAFRKCDCISCRIEASLHHLDCMLNEDVIVNDLRYLRDKYPDAYHENKSFFDKAIQKKKHQQINEELHKKLKSYQKKYPFEFQNLMDIDENLDYYDEEYEDEDEDFLPFSDNVLNVPYVNKDPKINRNDPCPCGSGKKYKRCCGA